MEGRWFGLIRSALYDGILDFKDIDRYDGRSISKESLILQEAERREQLRYLEFQLQFVNTAILDPESRAERAGKLLDKYDSICLPWYSRSQATAMGAQEDPKAYYDRIMQMHNKDKEE